MASFVTLNPNQKDEIIDALTSTTGSSGVASAINSLDVNGTGIASAISGLNVNGSGIASAISGLNVNGSGVASAITNLDVNGTGVASAINGLNIDNTGIISELQSFNTNILTQLQLLNANIELFNRNVDSVIWQQQNILGAKNLLKYPYYQSSATVNGITFTTNDMGVITANGTATSTANLILHTRGQGELNDFILNNGTYKINGCAQGGSQTTWYISYQYTNRNNQFAVLGNDFGNGDTDMIANGDYYSDDSVNLQVVVTIASGVTVNNLTFKPMVRLATINDDTFTPYTMTNQEITKYINSIQGGV